MPLRRPRKPISLAKLTTVLALTFSLAFGLCSVSGISISGGGSYRSAELLIGTSLVIEAVCATGLVVLGVVALIRARRKGPAPGIRDGAKL
jgi:hypothetical protein